MSGFDTLVSCSQMAVMDPELETVRMERIQQVGCNEKYSSCFFVIGHIVTFGGSTSAYYVLRMDAGHVSSYVLLNTEAQKHVQSFGLQNCSVSKRRFCVERLLQVATVCSIHLMPPKRPCHPHQT